MGCIRPEKGHLFLILIKAPSACQAVHLQGCLYLVGKSFAHLYKGYGAIWASRGPANEKTPYPLPQWLFHRRTHDQNWSIRILPWTFIWQLQVSLLMDGDAKLKGWSQPYSSIHGESLQHLANKEGRRVERWKKTEQALFWTLASSPHWNLYQHFPVTQVNGFSFINLVLTKFLWSSNEWVLLYSTGILISSAVANH